MEKITELKNVANLEMNKIIYASKETIVLEESSFVFHGKNNILFLEDNVHIKNSLITFFGDNSLVYLSSSKDIYYLNVSIYNNSVLYFGKNNYINGAVNGPLNLILSEQTHILVGNDCLFSYNIWLRTADPHLIYDVESRERRNYSKSIFIGDHVWIGQNVFLLKGSQIGSGSIIGASAVVSNKKIPSNTAWAGNPSKKIGENLFFTSKCVHRFTDTETLKNIKYENDSWIYKKDEKSQIDFGEIDTVFSNGQAVEKLKYIQDVINKGKKNRFYVENKEGEFVKKPGNWWLRICKIIKAI